MRYGGPAGRASMVILAGGRSSRMGTDKADLTLGDRTFLDIQIGKAAALGIRDVIVSGYRGRQSGVQVIPDPGGCEGPLCGIAASLGMCRGESALVVAADIPLLGADTLRRLIRAREETRAPAVILSVGGLGEPLIGCWRTALAETALQEARTGGRSVMSFLRSVGYGTLALCISPEEIINVNDPETYGRVRNLRREIS